MSTLALVRHALMGSCVIAPVLYTYYCILDSKLPHVNLRSVAIKVASDVFLANVAYYGLFYYGMSILEHKNHQKAKGDLKSAFTVSYLAGMVYWVPVMAFNFTFIGPTSRLAFVAAATYIEMNGLCLMRRWKS